MASLGHLVAIRRASSMQPLPMPLRCSSGLTAIPVRYKGSLLGLKYFLSMAQGFRVESANVATNRPRCLATYTVEVLMVKRTPFSVDPDDQCPFPYCDVRC